MTVPVYDWIAHHASIRGDKIAMEDLSTARSFTYRAFDQRVDRLASALHGKFDIGDRKSVV